MYFSLSGLKISRARKKARTTKGLGLKLKVAKRSDLGFVEAICVSSVMALQKVAVQENRWGHFFVCQVFFVPK